MSNGAGRVGEIKKMDRCHTLIPNFDIKFEGDQHGCLNTSAHFDGHITILPEGKIVLWEYEFCEGCTECNPEESECFNYKYLSKQELLIVLNKAYNNSIPEDITQIIKEL